MPEYETGIKENFNGCFHIENDILSIAQKIREWFNQHHNTFTRDEIRKSIIARYNPKTKLKLLKKS